MPSDVQIILYDSADVQKHETGTTSDTQREIVNGKRRQTQPQGQDMAGFVRKDAAEEKTENSVSLLIIRK
jgi:hypothetical protein